MSFMYKVQIVFCTISVSFRKKTTTINLSHTKLIIFPPESQFPLSKHLFVYYL